MDNNTVSIITVCFNAKNALERTLKNAIAQSYKQKEIVIIDGGSTDGTKEMIESYKNHIEIFVSESDNGIYDAMNKGIKRAAGEWVIMMNAGDVFNNDTVLEDIFKLDIPDNKDFIYSDYYDIGKDGKLKLNYVDRKRGIVFHQAAVYRKRLHKEYGFYLQTHPYIVSDLLFFLQIPEEKFMKVPIIISQNDCNGITRQGTWVAEEALGMRVGFGIESLPIAFLKLCKVKLLKLLGVI